MELGKLQGQLKSKFPEEILSWEVKNDYRAYADIAPESLLDVAGELYRNLRFRFCIASGVHTLEGFQVLYHFSYDQTGLVLSLRLQLGKEDPEIDSIAAAVPAADWIEREIHELFGIKFRGRPDLERLLMSEDWPAGVFPLRKDFSGFGENTAGDKSTE